MKTRNIYNKGFSLLELLVTIGLMGVIAVFVLSLSHSSKNLSKATATKNIMKEIRSAAVNYYSGHRDMPTPTGSNEVPVGAAELNLEQKHRLDAWGRYFYYNRALHPVHTTRTDINGISVNGKMVAAVIISGGPDQTLEPPNSPGSYSTAGDDIVLPISVSEQAYTDAIEDLRTLQDNARAFDKIFAGIDNNSSAGVDESGCVALIDCPLGITGNDPNCGTATLDKISDYSACGYSVASAAAFIIDFYSLGNSFLLDPWLNNYVWGDYPTYSSSDPRYHKFFSKGPSITDDSDDIIP